MVDTQGEGEDVRFTWAANLSLVIQQYLLQMLAL